MNTSLIQEDNVNAILKVEIKNADYQEKVNDALKAFRKKANIPGFRPGTVPLGMVKKMYGKSILADEINKLVGEDIYKYIQDNKLNVLGEPLPNEEKQQPIDFSTEGDYEFFFDVALAPQIKLSLSKDDKIDYYNISIDEELVDKQIESYKANYGKYEQIDAEAKETDLLKGDVCELENGKPKPGGINTENSVLMPSYMKDTEEQTKFVGVKKGAEIVFNPGKAYDGNDAEIASFLQIQKDSLDVISPEFLFTIKEVTRYEQAELNQDLFDKVFGKDVVTSEADFREKVKSSLSEQLAPDSDYKFLLDARQFLEKKVGDLKFPDTQLKKWLLVSGQERTPESIDEEYPKIVEDLKFHLIKEELVKQNDLKIEESDLQKIAVQTAKAQFAQYGMTAMPEDVISNYAKEMLKDKEASRNLVNRAMEDKIVQYLKDTLSLNMKDVSVDDFKKIFEESQNRDKE